MDIKSALEILNKDSKMQKLIKDYGLPDFEPKNDYFQSLMRSIVFQQLSGKVANIIYQRLINLLPNNKIIPREVLMLTNENMRQAGLSSQKIDYIKNFESLVTIEEQYLNGGLGSILLEKLSEKKIDIKIRRFGLDDRFYFENGGRDLLHTKYGLNIEKIITEIG